MFAGLHERNVFSLYTFEKRWGGFSKQANIWWRNRLEMYLLCYLAFVKRTKSISNIWFRDIPRKSRLETECAKKRCGDDGENEWSREEENSNTKWIGGDCMQYVRKNGRTCQRMLKFLGQNWASYPGIAPTKTQREKKEEKETERNKCVRKSHINKAHILTHISYVTR